MPTIFFKDFKGSISSADAVERGDALVVATGPHAGNWEKERANKSGKQGFYTSWAAAREAAVKSLNAKITRLEHGIAILKARRAELEKAAGP